MKSLNNKSVLEAALAYAKRGIVVIPLHSVDADAHCTCPKGEACNSPAKHPSCATGLKAGTTDPEQLELYFKNKNRNVGICTGKASGIVVLDVDFKNDSAQGFRDLMDKTKISAAELDELLKTRSAASGNGNHFYYLYPKGMILKNSASKLGSGLDIRGEGGYVVAPPSIHISGKCYEWTIDTPMADFPTAWLELLIQPAIPVFPAPAVISNGNSKPSGLIVPTPTVFQVPKAIGDGSRNNTLASMAGKLHYDGFSSTTIETALQIENERLCHPPLSRDDVIKIAHSITRNYQSGVVQLQAVTDQQITHWDDIQIAKLFIEDQSGKIKYNPEAKKWLVWTGTHWQTDRTDEVIKTAAVFSQNLYLKVPELVSTSAQMKDANKQVARSNSAAGLMAFLNLAKSYLAIAIADFDANPYLLNCKNGIIDLKTEQMISHHPNHLLTLISPFEFDRSCPIPHFTKFLGTIQPNPEIRDFIRRSIGYSLLGIARERAFWVMYGNGNNGKSVFIDLFSRLLGQYASSTTSASLMQQKSDHIPNDIARLKGKRFVVVPETAENEKLNAPLIKALSAGDTITARYLFAEYFDFEFSGKIWIATNHKPTITDHSKGFWDRLKIIPFSVDIPKENVIKRDDLLSALLAEGPGILAWAVRGCLEYFAGSDLQVPNIIKEEIALYKYEQDSIAQFVDECCNTDNSYETNNTELYQRYAEFCKDAGEYQRTQRRFTQNLKERGFEQGIAFGKRYWKAIGLK